ncbi:MAG TPA: M48 family metallopeptidase [Candidatus Acidoferrum sp.]|nr:M48 family metallopeptidase [Candidatus Acidoferrum sp.]
MNVLRRQEGASRKEATQAKRLVGHAVSACFGLLCLFFLLAPVASAQRTQLEPSRFNAFSPQQDIELGKRAAMDAARQLPLCNAPRVDAYLTQLGMRLVAKLPTNGVQYPFEFHCVNDKAINAFALPGGYVFINRGAIEAADNESQLAGVMAHEISHVALRHGTNQATKAEAAEGFLGIAGGIFGGSTGGALLTKLGAFAAGGVLLRYSRTAESQADVMGTQVLYDSGYDPRAMAQFFEKLEAETKGKNPPEFFSDHPNPERRVERVDEEVEKLGGAPSNARRDSPEFESIKREVLALPVVKKLTPAAAAAGKPPAPPSGNFATHQANGYSLKYPDNWKKYPDTNGSGASFAPDGGVVDDGTGHAALAYGLIVSVTQASGDASDLDALNNATQQMIQELQKSNPNMKITRPSERVRLNGQPGLATYLSNDSPIGGQETDWIITTLRPEGLVSFVCVAPQLAYEKYDKTFNAILDSVRFEKK